MISIRRPRCSVLGSKSMTVNDGNGLARIRNGKMRCCVSRGSVRTMFSIVFALIHISPAPAGESSADSENKSKFLLNFAEFTDWPETAFADKQTPLTIAILGHDPFGKDLDTLAENDVLKGRSVVVRRHRKVEEIKTCHILYVSESQKSRMNCILRALKGKPVLTVSEIENSAVRGVMIRTKAENDKIRLAINLESAKAVHLTLKSKLLRQREIVEPANK